MATGFVLDTGSIEFLSPPPSYIQLKCPVCFELLIKDPKLVSCCGHHFCGECLGKLRKKSCPLCNEAFQSISDKGHKRMINSLMVYCTNKGLSCKWKGELGELPKHLSLDETGDCQYAEVPCPKGCGQYVPRSLLDEHKIEYCPNRLKTCHMCSNYRDTVANYNKTKHNLTCPELFVACPFPECKMILKRNELPAHMSMCPYSCTKCLSMDCQWIGPSSMLLEHMQKTHVEIFSAHYTQLIKSKDEEIKRLTSQKAQSDSKVTNQRKQLTQQAATIKQLKQEKERLQQHVQLPQPLPQIQPPPQVLVTRDVIVREFSKLRQTNTIFRSGSICCTDPPSRFQVELCVYPNGLGPEWTTKISVFLFVNSVAPTGTSRNIHVEVRLFNHKKHMSHGKWFELNPSLAAACAHDGRIGVGFKDFISHSQMARYLHEDCLLFELYPID